VTNYKGGGNSVGREILTEIRKTLNRLQASGLEKLILTGNGEDEERGRLRVAKRRRNFTAEGEAPQST